MDYTKVRYEKLADGIIKGLKARNMEGYYVDSSEEACRLALSLIPEGKSVTWGGFTSGKEIGLIRAVKEGSYRVIDREEAKTPEQVAEALREAFFCHTYLMSANALTQDGVILNLDGQSNRVAALCFGPEQVVMIVGVNKIVRDVEEGIARVRNIAAPINAQRFANVEKKTPCMITGSCGDCKSPGCICCNFVITRFSRVPGRIKVIIVGESLGF